MTEILRSEQVFRPSIIRRVLRESIKSQSKSLVKGLQLSASLNSNELMILKDRLYEKSYRLSDASIASNTKLAVAPVSAANKTIPTESSKTKHFSISVEDVTNSDSFVRRSQRIKSQLNNYPPPDERPIITKASDSTARDNTYNSNLTKTIHISYNGSNTPKYFGKFNNIKVGSKIKRECKECHLIYTDLKGFNRHYQSVHLNQRNQCGKCYQIFVKSENLRKHVKRYKNHYAREF